MIVIDPDDTKCKLLRERGIQYIKTGLTKDNYKEILAPLLTNGKGKGFCVNLSVNVSSLDVMKFARLLDTFYIDTVVEPWTGFYFDDKLDTAARSNYALREAVLEERRNNLGGVTAVSCCGANPGMVSWLVKQAVVNLASDMKIPFTEPKTREDWAKLMQKVGVKGIHIAERDTQRSKHLKEMDTFVNTWSVDGFITEGYQPAELGWGTHEKWMPANAGTHKEGCQAAIYLMQPGANTRLHTCARRPARSMDSSSRITRPSRLPTITPWERVPGRITAPPAIMPTIHRTTRSCLSTKCSAAWARHRKSTTSSTKTRSLMAATSWACCFTGMEKTPIGTAPSCPLRKRANSPRTRTLRPCR